MLHTYSLHVQFYEYWIFLKLNERNYHKMEINDVCSPVCYRSLNKTNFYLRSDPYFLRIKRIHCSSKYADLSFIRCNVNMYSISIYLSAFGFTWKILYKNYITLLGLKMLYVRWQFLEIVINLSHFVVFLYSFKRQF